MSYDAMKSQGGFDEATRPTSGVGTGSRESADEYTRGLAWAREHLPGEEPVHVAAARMVVQNATKREPTVEEVRIRMRNWGHLREEKA